MAPIISANTRPPPPFLGSALPGELFLYAPGRAAFESNTNNNNNKCVLLGGLSDGLVPVPYTQALQQACAESHYSLVQPVLSSSYTGFGHGSLDQDVAELDELLEYLLEYRTTTSNESAAKIALVGHSTGTQDIVHYLKHGKPNLIKQHVQLVALQAPVSDRESATICHDGCHATNAEHQEALRYHLEYAKELRKNDKSDEMMPRAAFWAPITASRYLALFEKGGTDDYFSSDYTDDELRDRLRHVGGACGAACLVVCSGSDEYVPKTVNDSERLMQRLCDAMNADCTSSSNTMNAAIPLYLPLGNHNLSSRNGADAEIFVAKVKELLQKSPSTS